MIDLSKTNGNRIDSWKPDPVTREDGSAKAAMARYGKPLLSKPSLLGLPKRRRFQGTMGSCVAQSIVDAVESSILIHAPDQESDFAALFAYEVARAQEYAGEDPRLVILEDTGAMPSHAVAGVRRLGLIPEAEYPYDENAADRRAPPDVIAKAFDGRGLTTWLVLPGGDTAEACAEGITHGLPPIIAMTVDSGFSAWDDTKAPIDFIDLRDPYRGGHMMAVAEVTAKYVYLFNWWTFGGTANGLWVMTREAFNRYARDVFLVRAPGLVDT